MSKVKVVHSTVSRCHNALGIAKTRLLTFDISARVTSATASNDPMIKLGSVERDELGPIYRAGCVLYE